MSGVIYRSMEEGLLTGAWVKDCSQEHRQLMDCYCTKQSFLLPTIATCLCTLYEVLIHVSPPLHDQMSMVQILCGSSQRNHSCWGFKKAWTVSYAEDSIPQHTSLSHFSLGLLLPTLRWWHESRRIKLVKLCVDFHLLTLPYPYLSVILCLSHETEASPHLETWSYPRSSLPVSLSILVNGGCCYACQYKAWEERWMKDACT